MSDREEWRPVEGYGGGYEVSNYGRVRSWKLRGSAARDGSLAKAPIDLAIQPGVRGYPSVNLYMGGKMRTHRIHKLVAATFIGPAPEGLHVCHSDGNTFNNHVSNLRYDTAQGNADDKWRHGTVLAGSRHPRAKLSDDLVREIRAKAVEGETFTSMAASLGVAISTIARAARRERWKLVA